MKRLLPFVALASVAATCNRNTGPLVSSDVRIDGAGQAPDGVDSTLPDMCVAPNGTVYVVWVDDRLTPDGNASNVWMNRKLGGGERDEGWLPTPIRVNQFASPAVTNPKVACDDSAVHVVWQDIRDGEVESQQIYYNTSSTEGDTWVYPEDLQIEDDPDGRADSFEPVIAVAGASVYISWYDGQFGAYDILFRRSPNRGLEWPEAPKRVDGDAQAGTAHSSSVQMATAENGNVIYLTWEDARSGQTDIYFTRSVDQGLSFTEAVRLDTGDDDLAGSSFSPQVAADGSHVYVVWHDSRNGDNNDVYMRYSGDSGATWNDESRADQSDPAGFTQSLFPRVCVAGPRAYVAWEDNRANGFYRAFFNVANGGQWGGAEFQLDTDKLDGVLGSRTMRVACEGDTVAVGWLDSRADGADEGFNDIYYNVSTTGGGADSWLDLPELPRVDSINEGTAYKRDVTLAIHEGELLGSWADGRNGGTDIFFQKLPMGEDAPEIQVEEVAAP